MHKCTWPPRVEHVCSLSLEHVAAATTCSQRQARPGCCIPLVQWAVCERWEGQCQPSPRGALHTHTRAHTHSFTLLHCGDRSMGEVSFTPARQLHQASHVCCGPLTHALPATTHPHLAHSAPADVIRCQCLYSPSEHRSTTYHGPLTLTMPSLMPYCHLIATEWERLHIPSY